MENTATLETLINLACTNLKVDLSELQAKYRGRAIVDKRRLLCHALAIRGFTVEKIGKALNRDHSSITHLIGTSRDFLGTDLQYRTRFNNLNKFLYGAAPM